MRYRPDSYAVSLAERDGLILGFWMYEHPCERCGSTISGYFYRYYRIELDELHAWGSCVEDYCTHECFLAGRVERGLGIAGSGAQGR